MSKAPCDILLRFGLCRLLTLFRRIGLLLLHIFHNHNLSVFRGKTFLTLPCLVYCLLIIRCSKLSWNWLKETLSVFLLKLAWYLAAFYVITNETFPQSFYLYDLSFFIFLIKIFLNIKFLWCKTILMTVDFNSLQPGVAFLYLLKTSENRHRLTV